MTTPKDDPAAGPMRAAIYARFSHADQIGGFSIQAQQLPSFVTVGLLDAPAWSDAGECQEPAAPNPHREARQGRLGRPFGMRDGAEWIEVARRLLRRVEGCGLRQPGRI